MNPIELIAPELLAQSRVLNELGTADRVWRPGVALEVLNDLVGKHIAVLGGDIYEDQEGRASPLYDNWHCDQKPSEPFTKYADRSVQAAIQYLRKYPFHAHYERTLLVGLVLMGMPEQR